MHCLTLSEALRTEQKYQPQGLCGKQVQQFSRGVRKQSRVFLSQWPWVLVWEDFVNFIGERPFPAVIIRDSVLTFLAHGITIILC